jgi:predicted negative regulator of RcsB-dependent stress response
MTTEAPTAIQLERSINWLDANKQKLIRIALVIAVVALAVSYLSWKRGQQEVAASTALSDVPPGAGAAEAYLKLAAQYPKTTAAPRAVLTAAGELFAAGKLAEAETQFKRLLEEYSDSPYRVQALLGAAACLDAQGKTAEAVSRYEQIVAQYSKEAVASQAKSALARLYEIQNQPAKALPLYEELQRTEAYGSFGLEANIRRLALLAKYPDLAKVKSPAGSLK